MFNTIFFFRKSYCLGDNVENFIEPDRPHITIGRMRVACCIPNATNTHSEYVILIALQLQQWLPERVSILRYTHSAQVIHVQ